MRFPIELVIEPIPPADWTFDTDGDASGWVAENALTPAVVADGVLATASTAEDPILIVTGLELPAAYDRLHVRMKVVGARATAVVFFTTEDAPNLGVDHVSFDVVTDGEFHDYELDMSTAPTWRDTISGRRLDPVQYGGSDIEIDRIWLTPPD